MTAIGDVPDVEDERPGLGRDDPELTFDSEDVVEHDAKAQAEERAVALRGCVFDVGHAELVRGAKDVDTGGTTDLDVRIRDRSLRCDPAGSQDGCDDGGAEQAIHSKSP